MAIQRLRILSAALLAGCALGYAGAVSGAGFAIIEHSAKGLGAAFSGGAASAEDTSTVWFNPAGMTQLDGTQIDAASHIIVPSSDFTNEGSVINPAVPGVGGTPLPGRDSKDPGVAALVPNFYYVRELRPNLKFGLGVNAPFGLKTNYSQNWVGRYHALTSDLKTFNINPGLAYKFDNGFSLGFGVSAQYAKARLTNAIDKSTACLGAAPGAVCNAFGLVTPATPTTDGYIDLKDADDWSYGYNVGALYEFSPRTRVGVHWRSKISHELEGKAEFTNTADLAGLFGGGRFTNQTFSAKATMPESLSVSGFHQINPKVAVMGDFTWTRWNRFDELVINFDGGHPQNVTPENWNNSIRVSGGVSYAYNDRLTLRGGLAYDEEPIPDATRRTPRIPGDDRTWVAVGASYQRSDKLSLDVGYTHLFVGDVPINNTEVNTGHVLIGEYDADVNIFSAQVNYRFR